VHSPLVSPNKTKLAFMGESMSYVYDINTWKQSQVFTDEKLISLVWKSDTELFLGGENTLRLWSWVKNSSEVLALSSPGDYAWDAQKNILSKFGRKNYLYDKNRGSWQEVSEGNTRSREVQNARWRIFIDEMEQGHFSNSLFARKLSGLSTNIALFNNSKDKPAQRPRVALAIDALDSSDGLTPILSALHKNNIRASFFINGEFLRKFPTAVKEIASLGHQCGSMFYIPYTLDTRLYAIDETFIRRGLARNEDDFFYLIGKELSLIWHAPDYFSNAIIQSASKKAGYKLIDSPYPTGDTLTLEEATEKNLPYRSSSQIIDSIVTSLKPGLIIPISCGLQNGTRLDYLYDKIDVLIAAILSAGYDIVPVSDL
jgi:peptidoglycan/xylan/chitin deacetylase (PgdA/CDA1 family)